MLSLKLFSGELGQLRPAEWDFERDGKKDGESGGEWGGEDRDGWIRGS